MQVYSFLQHNAYALGIDLGTSTDNQKLEVYQHTLDEIRKLPDVVDMRTISIDVLNVLEGDLRNIISGLDTMSMQSDGPAQARSLVAIKTYTRQARAELSVASDMLNRDDSNSANARRDYYTAIINWQESLTEALKHF